MNIATGKLEAPIIKQADSKLDLVEKGTEYLLKALNSKGLVGDSLPLDSYVLRAGLGALGQQATSRALSKHKKAPKLLKEIAPMLTAATVGGSSGAAGGLAARLNKPINELGALSAARAITDMTALGTGSELAISPFYKGDMGAKETLSRLLGGIGLGTAGAIAGDVRRLQAAREFVRAGNKLPKGLPKPDMHSSLGKVIRRSYRDNKLPAEYLLGGAGAALATSGHPLLATPLLMSAPLANKKSSKLIGDVLRELRSKKVNKNALDDLYKTSSIKLAAPVYRTQPAYPLDAPTMEKLGFGLLKGLGTLVGGKLLPQVARRTAQGYRAGSGAWDTVGRTLQGIGRGFVNEAGRAFETARKLTPGNQSYKIRRGAKRLQDVSRNQGVTEGGLEAGLLNLGVDASNVAANTRPVTSISRNNPRSIGQWFKDTFEEGIARSRQLDQRKGHYHGNPQAQAELMEAGEGLFSTTSRKLQNAATSRTPAQYQTSANYTAAPVMPTAPGAQQLQQAVTEQTSNNILMRGIQQLPRPGFRPSGSLTSNQAAMDVINARGVNPELVSNLKAIEGKEGLRGFMGAVEKANVEAFRGANLNKAADINRQATNELMNMVSTAGIPANEVRQVQQAISQLGMRSEPVTANAIKTVLGRSGTSVQQLETLLSSPSGRKFMQAQNNLAGAMQKYENILSTNLQNRMTKVMATSEKNFASRVGKLSKGKSPGEVQLISDVEKLVQARVDLLNKAGAPLTDRRRAAELMNAVEQGLANGNMEEIAKLKEALANPTAKLNIAGTNSRLGSLFESPAVQDAFTLSRQQAGELQKVVTRSGRGTKDVSSQVNKIFNPKNAVNPNTAAGTELAQIMTSQEARAGLGQEILNLANQTGAGKSAYNKLVNANPASRVAGNFTMAELGALGSVGQPKRLGAYTGATPAAQGVFDKLVLNAKGTLENSVKNIEKEITNAESRLNKLNKKLSSTPQYLPRRGRGPRIPNPKYTSLQAEVTSASAEVTANTEALGIANSYIKTRNTNLKNHFDTVNNAFAEANRVVGSEVSVTGINYTRPGAEVAQAATEAAQTAGSRRGGVVGAGALALGGGYMASRPRRARPATTARQQVMNPQASWGLSALQAPVVYRKKQASFTAAPVKLAMEPPVVATTPPPKLKLDGNKSKIKAPVSSPTTATAEAMQRSALQAPVMGGY